MKKPKMKYTVIVVSILFACIFIVRSVVEHYYKKSWETNYGTPYPKSPLMTPQTFLELGKASASGNRYKDAQQFYEIGTKYFPHNIQLWINLARVEEILGNRTKAAFALKNASSLASQDATILAQLAQLYYQTNHFSEAYEALKKAVVLDPTNVDYLYRLAQLANLNQYYSTSYQIYQKLSQLNPSNPDLSFALTKTEVWEKETPPKDHAKELLEKASSSFEKSQQKEAQDFLNQYVILFGETQKYQLLIAQQIYLDILKKNPEDSETYYRLAKLDYEFNYPKEALENIKAAVAVKPHNVEYLNLKALIARQLDLTQEQREAYIAILTVNPNDAEAYKNLLLLDVTQQMSLTTKQIEESPYLLKVVYQQREGDLVGALNTLKEYSKIEGQNPLYQAMLAYLAIDINKCNLQQIQDQYILSELAELFTFFSNLKQDDSFLFQDKAEIIAHQLVLENPCSIEKLDLYAKTIRIHENFPFVDFVAARNTYNRILQIDPYNQHAFRNLAQVTALLGEVDQASCLYNQYVHTYPPDKETLIEFAGLLEDQGNIGLALHYLDLYEFFYGSDTYFIETKARILNTGGYSTPALCLSKELLEENPDSYNAWYNYADAMAILNCPHQAIYGYDQVYSIQPGNPATNGVLWTVWPQLMSNATFFGRFYQETTTLTEYFERIEGAYALSPDLKVLAGAEGFQTSSTATFNLVLGLGSLRGINGEAWGSENSAWIGFNKIFNPKLITRATIGGGYQQVGNIHSWTPTFSLDLFSRVNDYLNVDFLSTYGFMLISPRNLSLKIRQWRNFLTFDWRPIWGHQLITSFDGKINTDGNKQLEINLYPRKTIYFRKHWNVDVGLWGNWYTSAKSRETGYYQPAFYQSYAGQVLIAYLIDYLNIIKIEGTIGTQKDNFSDRFGFLGDFQCQGLFNLSLNWYLFLLGEYYYIDTSQGYFSFINFQGGLTYRF